MYTSRLTGLEYIVERLRNTTEKSFWCIDGLLYRGPNSAVGFKMIEEREEKMK